MRPIPSKFSQVRIMDVIAVSLSGLCATCVAIIAAHFFTSFNLSFTEAEEFAGFSCFLVGEVAIYPRMRRLTQDISLRREAASFGVVVLGAFLAERIMRWTGEDWPIFLVIPTIVASLLIASPQDRHGQSRRQPPR